MTRSGWLLGEPGEWDQHFLIALGLSVLLHAFVLSLSLPRHPVSRISGASTLNAVLTRTPAAGTSSASIPKTNNRSLASGAQVLTREDSAAFIRRQREESARQAARRRVEGESKPGEGVASQRAEQTPSGRETRVALKPGEVSVVFLIRDDGHVGQIIWNKLPALTYEQIDRVEAAIRARKLPGAFSGQVRTETINILALIDEIEGRKPARKEDKAVPEAPPAEPVTTGSPAVPAATRN